MHSQFRRDHGNSSFCLFPLWNSSELKDFQFTKIKQQTLFISEATFFCVVQNSFCHS